MQMLPLPRFALTLARSKNALLPSSRFSSTAAAAQGKEEGYRRKLFVVGCHDLDNM